MASKFRYDGDCIEIRIELRWLCKFLPHRWTHWASGEKVCGRCFRKMDIANVAIATVQNRPREKHQMEKVCTEQPIELSGELNYRESVLNIGVYILYK